MSKTGAVKWFNPQKGYGFIAPDDGSKGAFVHITAVELAGLDTLLVAVDRMPAQRSATQK